MLKFVSYFSGCRSQACRKRRSVTQPEVLLYLTGCTGQTKPWLRQVAFCLGRSTVQVALTIKDWYEQTYRTCKPVCNPKVLLSVQSDFYILKANNCVFVAILLLSCLNHVWWFLSLDTTEQKTCFFLLQNEFDKTLIEYLNIVQYISAVSDILTILLRFLVGLFEYLLITFKFFKYACNV